MDAGFKDAARLEKDKDWDGLRDKDEFRKLLAVVKSRSPASESTKDKNKP
jgi:hypothetical protein